MKYLMTVLVSFTLSSLAFAGKYPSKVNCGVVRVGEDSSDGEVYLYNEQFTLSLKDGSYIHKDVIPGTDLTITSFIAAGNASYPNWMRVDVESTSTGEVFSLQTLQLVSQRIPLVLDISFPAKHVSVYCSTGS
ncbi:MAG: hypothetical protein ACXWQO_19030 [Bdellovibrionota bacterium]